MRSLYNPFSPLRYMNLWEVAAFGGDDSGGGNGGGDNDNDTIVDEVDPGEEGYDPEPGPIVDEPEGANPGEEGYDPIPEIVNYEPDPIADSDFGMGSNDGVSDVGTGDIDEFDAVADEFDAVADSDFGMGSNDGTGDAVPIIPVTPDLGYDFGMGSNDGTGDVGTGDIVTGGVDFDSGGDYLGEFGGSGIDLDGGITAGTPDLGYDFGMGSNDGVSDAVPIVPVIPPNLENPYPPGFFPITPPDDEPPYDDTYSNIDDDPVPPAVVQPVVQPVVPPKTPYVGKAMTFAPATRPSMAAPAYTAQTVPNQSPYRLRPNQQGVGSLANVLQLQKYPKVT